MNVWGSSWIGAPLLSVPLCHTVTYERWKGLSGIEWGEPLEGSRTGGGHGGEMLEHTMWCPTLTFDRIGLVV
jgi:hypothetical protein